MKPAESVKKYQANKATVTIWLQRDIKKEWSTFAESKGLSLGVLARVLLKNYCEGKIDLKL
tara:strand:- start:41 stop:223 length:183 start_codon:yes stop_codon:yes gene_type:complete